jgi:hypothetical protein
MHSQKGCSELARNPSGWLATEQNASGSLYQHVPFFTHCLCLLPSKRQNIDLNSYFGRVLGGGWIKNLNFELRIYFSISCISYVEWSLFVISQPETAKEDEPIQKVHDVQLRLANTVHLGNRSKSRNRNLAAACRRCRCRDSTI